MIKILTVRKFFSCFKSSLLLQKGFTLVELLVVISIIGILSGLLFANFGGVREKSRDGVRKSDLGHIQSALELYRADQGSYPALGGLPGDFPLECNKILQNQEGSITYMKKVPCDPSSNQHTFMSLQIRKIKLII